MHSGGFRGSHTLRGVSGAWGDSMGSGACTVTRFRGAHTLSGARGVHKVNEVHRVPTVHGVRGVHTVSVDV